MDILIKQVSTIPWFTLVPSLAWDSWVGPESPEVERIGEKTQELLDFLNENGIEAEPSISEMAHKLMGEMPPEFLANSPIDLYDAKSFASWIGLWLIVARQKYAQTGFKFPNWAENFLNIYENGLWPSGITESNEPIYSKGT